MGSMAMAAGMARLVRVPPRTRTFLLLTVVAILSGLDLTLFRAVIASLRESRHLLNEDLGVAARASVVAYLVTLPLGGFLVHLAGPRRILLIAGAVMAAAGCGMGFVYDARSYALLCMLLGLAAGAVPTATVAAIGFWFAPQEQARAIGCLQAAPALGGILTTLLISEAAGRWWGLQPGVLWRVVVLTIGIVTVVWVFAAGLWYRARPASPGAAAAGIETDLPAGPLWPVGVVIRGGLLMLFALVEAYDLGLGGDWLGNRLFTNWHLDLAEAPLAPLFGLAGSFAGIVAGGLASDGAFHHSGNVKSARQVVIGVGFLLSVLSLPALRDCHDLPGADLWRAVTAFCLGLPAAPLWSIALTIAPGKAGPVLGMLGLGTSLGLLASPGKLAGLLSPGSTLPLWIGIGAALLCGVGGFFLDPALEIEKPEPPPKEQASARH